MEKIASPTLIRCLRLLAAAGDSGATVTATYLNAFADQDPPQSQLRLGKMYRQMRWEFYEHTPAVADYFTGVGWANGMDNGDDEVLEITRLGRAVLVNAEREAQEAYENAEFAITMNPDSPMDYVQFLEKISTMGEGVMVIDRYASVRAIVQLANLLPVARVLSSSNRTRTDSTPTARIADLESMLGAVSDPAEVRLLDANPSPLHDRVVLPLKGSGLLLGGSLGGTQVNTVVTLSEGMTADLRTRHEQHWGDAKPVEPKAPEPAKDPAN